MNTGVVVTFLSWNNKKWTFSSIVMFFVLKFGKQNNSMHKFIVSDIHDDLRTKIYALTESSSQLSSSQISSDPEARSLDLNAFVTARRKRKLRNITRTRDREIQNQARRFKLIEDESSQIGNVSPCFVILMFINLPFTHTHTHTHYLRSPPPTAA